MSQNNDERNDELVSPDTKNDNGEKKTNLEWSYSPKAFRARCLLYWIITIALLVGGYFLAFGQLQQYFKAVWIAVAVMVALLWLHFFVLYFYRTLTISYKLTDRCLYSYEGVLKRTSDTMELIHVVDIQMEQTLFDRILNGGVGKITIMCPTDKTIGENGKMIIMGVDKPGEIRDQIDLLRSELRRKRAILAGG